MQEVLARTSHHKLRLAIVLALSTRRGFGVTERGYCTDMLGRCGPARVVVTIVVAEEDVDVDCTRVESVRAMGQ